MRARVGPEQRDRRWRVPGQGGSRPRLYWVTRKEQLDALASAVRLDILDRMVALGPLSVKTLSASMGMKPTAIYQHLQKLERLELVRSTRTTGARGRPAAVYEAAGTRVRLARAPLTTENRKPMAKIARAVAGQAAKDYSRAFASDSWRIEGPTRNHWHFRGLMRPSRQRLAKINALFDQLAELIWTSDSSPGKQLISVAWFLAPVGARPRRRRVRSA